MRAAITHVRRPALTIRSADRNVGTGATGWGTKRALRRQRCPPGESGARRRMTVTYPGPTTMGTPTARRASQAGSGSFFGPERLAVPPHHAGVNVDDEPPARRVAWVAADRPRVGHEGTACEPVVRLARDRPHRARSGAVVNEEGRFMRMADKSERPQGAARQDPGGRRLSEEVEQRVARRAVPAVDAVTAGQCAARQPEHIASTDDDLVRPERPGVVISRDQQVKLGSRAYELSRDRLASDQIPQAPAFVDPGCCHGGKHCQEPVMATVHVGANADPHPSIILVPPEGWPALTEGRRASSTPLRCHPSCRMTTRGGRHSHLLSLSSLKKEDQVLA